MALTLTPWATDTSSDVHQAEIVRRSFGAVVGDDGGVADGTAMQVTQKSGTPNMSVDVAAGFAFVPGSATDGGVFGVHNDATVNVSITASDPSNPRITLVLLEVDNTTTYSASITTLDGTPAAVPTPPSITADNYLLLATIEVPASASSITNADITDERVPVGGVPTGTELIEEIELVSAGSSIDFTNIPQTYRDLRLNVYASASNGTGDVTLRMQFNGVTSATYRTIINQNQAGTIVGAVNDGITSWRIGDVSDVTASNWSQVTVDVVNYAGGQRPSPTFQGICRRATDLDRFVSGGLITLDSSTAPVSRITVSVGTGTLAAGSVARLYGIR